MRKCVFQKNSALKFCKNWSWNYSDGSGCITEGIWLRI